MVHQTERRSTGGRAPTLSPTPSGSNNTILKNRDNFVRQGYFRFLDLPPELRNRIYDHLFTVEDDSRPGICELKPRDSARFWETCTYGYIDEDRSMLAILQTCSQINDEAHTIRYNCNTIRFSSASDMARVLGAMNPNQLSAISHVEIDLVFVWESIWCWGSLKLLPNLFHLRIIDVEVQSEEAEQGCNRLLGAKIKELRGLSNLEVVLEEVCRTEKYAREIGFAKQLEDNWKAFVTQPKSGGN